MAAGGVASSYAAEQSGASEQLRGPSNEQTSRIEEQAKHILETSFNEQDSPHDAHTDAIKKLELLHEISPSQTEKDTLLKLMDSLQKTDPHHLRTPDQRQVWMSAQYNTVPIGAALAQAERAAASANPFKPQNVFGPKPISKMSAAEMSLKKEANSEGSKDQIPDPDPPLIKKILGLFKGT